MFKAFGVNPGKSVFLGESDNFDECRKTCNEHVFNYMRCVVVDGAYLVYWN